MNEDILGNHIYTHIISDQYAARVCNFSTYDAISKDVIHRWVYPLVPDNTDEACSYGRRNIYLNTNVSLAFGCELHEDVVIGRNTSIGVSTHITQSSIGHNCRIGDNVVIEGAYLWDNCVIERGSKVYRSILCDSVYVKSNVVVEAGCVLSYGVIVGPEFTVKRGSMITTSRDSGVPENDEGEWGEEGGKVAEVTHMSPTEDSDPTEVGREGRGLLWRPPTEEEDEESDQFAVEEWPADDAQSSGGESSSGSSRDSSPGPAQPSHQFSEGADVDNLLFYNEIIDLIRSGLAEKVNTDNTILMINAAKHAYNIPIHDVPLAIVKAIMEGPRRSTASTSTPTGNPQTAPDTMTYIKSAVTFFTSLLRHYIRDQSLQMSVVETLVDCAEKQGAVLTNLARLVLLLYNQDVLEESVILSWHERYSSSAGDSSKKLEVLKTVKPVIEWLQTASEESSEDDEGE